MRRKTKRLSFSDQIRQAVRESGLTRYRIAQQTCIDKGTLSRFVNGEQGLEMATLDRLAEFLNLRVVADHSNPEGN